MTPKTKAQTRRAPRKSLRRRRSIPRPKLDSLAEVIGDLPFRLSQIADLIDAELESSEADSSLLARLFTLYGQMASRLGRLLRDQRALSGAAADGLAGAVAQAIEELKTEAGISAEL
jgi:hypothetical protein